MANNEIPEDYEPEGDCCVYTHSYNGVVFYVGKGNAYRPYYKHGRNQEWHKYIEEIGDYDINIIMHTHDEIEAYEEEKALIIELRPACNVQHCKESVVPEWKRRRRGVACPDEVWTRIKVRAIIAGVDTSEYLLNLMIKAIGREEFSEYYTPQARSEAQVTRFIKKTKQ